MRRAVQVAAFALAWVGLLVSLAFAGIFVERHNSETGCDALCVRVNLKAYGLGCWDVCQWVCPEGQK